MPNVLDKVVAFFERGPKRIHTKQQVYESCWDLPWYPGCENTLRVHISLARDQLPGSIMSVRGMGYTYHPKEKENAKSS